jgi:hypothetical protein
MASRVLEGSFSKIGRARSLLEEFAGIVTKYSQGLKIHEVREPDADNLVHVKLKVFEPVPETAIHLAAEIVYHVRSALDIMVSEIGRQAGLNDTRHLQFPFTRTRKQFDEKGNLKKMQGLADDVQALLRELEPFEDGNERLWGLGAFANVDKHNMLIPIGGIGRVGAILDAQVDGGGHPGSTGFILGVLESLLEGLTIVKIGPIGSYSARSLGFEGFVGFGDIPVFAKSYSIPTLIEIIDLGEKIVQRFSSHCFDQ